VTDEQTAFNSIVHSVSLWRRNAPSEE